MFRPSVGFAAVKLLEDAGCQVEVPEAQTCCGQPAYNSGDKADAQALARQVIAAFRGYDYVVAPSGSCGGMIVKHYPELFAAGSADHAAALDLARRTHELVSFLTRVMKVAKVTAAFPARATYHDSCSGLRVLRFWRHLLRQISRHLRQDAGEEAEAYPRHRRRYADRRRPRLPDEHGGQAEA
jgi:L-lactate dehydrogenase complex protein LldE